MVSLPSYYPAVTDYSATNYGEDIYGCDPQVNCVATQASTAPSSGGLQNTGVATFVPLVASVILITAAIYVFRKSLFGRR